MDHPDESDLLTDLKDKLRTLGVACVLGFGGYGLSIFWYTPFRLASDLPSFTPGYGETMVMNDIALGLAAVTIGILYLKYSGKGREYIDVETPTKRRTIFVIGGTLSLLAALYAINSLKSHLNVDATQHTASQAVAGGSVDPQYVLLMIPLSFLLIGPAEEFIFRNLVQKRLYESFTKASSVIIASIIFSTIHIPAYATGTTAGLLTSLATVFTLSLFLGGFYAMTEDLIVVAVMHGAYNAVIFGRWYLAISGSPLPF